MAGSSAASAATASDQGSLGGASGGGGVAAAGQPVFRFGDRVLLELRTMRYESGFLGLDDDLSEANPMEHEMPPLALMTDTMHENRLKMAAAGRGPGLPPPLDDGSMKLGAARDDDDKDDDEFYAENCVFELSSSNNRNKGLELKYGFRFALVHVATGKHLMASSGEDGKTHLVLADLGFGGIGLAAQFEMQPCYADRVRGERMEHGDHCRITSAANHDGVQVKREVAEEGRSTEAYILKMTAHANKMTGFMVRLFAKYAPGLTNLVKGGDVIRIQHIERDMFLRADYGKATDLLHRSGKGNNKYDYVWDKAKDGHKDPPLSFNPNLLLDHVSVRINPEDVAQEAELRDLFRVEVVSQSYRQKSSEQKWMKQLAG